MSIAIELTGLECRLGAFTLGPIDLSIPSGVILGLVGPNGAGKTTTLDLIMGMGHPDSGSIRVLGLQQPRDEVAIKLRTAYVSPNENYTAWGKVGLLLDFIRGFYPDWDNDRCVRLMKDMAITRADKIASLSFGGKIKLSLLIALSRDAELLLLDEPTLGLDVKSRRLLFAQLLEIMKRENRTVIISSHQLDDLERIADQIAIIKDGKLVSMGATDALLSRFVCLDAVLSPGSVLPDIGGIGLIGQDGTRVRLLCDTSRTGPDELSRHGVEILGETPMTLEELFVALTDGEAQ